MTAPDREQRDQIRRDANEWLDIDTHQTNCGPVELAQNCLALLDALEQAELDTQAERETVAEWARRVEQAEQKADERFMTIDRLATRIQQAERERDEALRSLPQRDDGSGTSEASGLSTPRSASTGTDIPRIYRHDVPGTGDYGVASIQTVAKEDWDRLDARLATVPALVEALERIRDGFDGDEFQDTADAYDQHREIAREALTAYHQASTPPRSHE